MQTDPEEDYARGWVPFLDCKIYLDSRPLIPRVETEYWVEQALKELKAEKVLDLFAGSGAIGIAVAKHFPNAHVDFGEIDASHFPTIQKNIQENCTKSDVARKSKIIETDVFSNISGTYDAIFANPPYLSRNQSGRVQDSVVTHEPDNALFADEDGFALIRKSIEGAYAHLESRGALYIEHEPEQAQAIAELGKAHGFKVENRKDQFGTLRYSVLKSVA